jgi:hypothetical protein
MKVQRGSRRTAQLFLQHWHYMGLEVNATPRPLYPREKDPVPIVQGAGWATGPIWTGMENLAPTRIRYPDRPAGSDSLHRLSYPWPQYIFKKFN